MVELFAAVAFFDGPRTGRSGFACRQAESSPRRPGCTKLSWNDNSRAPWMGLRSHRLLHPFWSMAALLIRNEHGVSASPPLRPETGGRRPDGLLETFDKIESSQQMPFLRLPLEASRLPHRIECRDYSEATGFCHTRAACRSSFRISPTSLRRAGQANLLASSSTGQSRDGWFFLLVSTVWTRGISPTVPANRRVNRNSVPLAALVRCGLPGAIACRRLSCVPPLAERVFALDSKQRVAQKRQPRSGIRYPTTELPIPYPPENSTLDKCGTMTPTICGC